MKLLIFSLVLMNVSLSCQQASKEPAEEKALPAKTLVNLAYGPDSLQKMDVYLPANRTTEHTKSLILIHGGGWTSGSKADFAAYIDSLQKRLPDYALFNLNYRLVNGSNLFPTQEDDVKGAVEFIAAKAADFHVNKEQFSLLGFSAGAHLALLQAYKYSSPKIRAVIDYFGPTDLVTMYKKPWHPLAPLALQMITGTTPEANEAIFKQSSPVNFITQQSPPTLILHGGRDQVVDVSQSELLAKTLDEHHVQHELHVYPGEGHGRWYGAAQTAAFNQVEQFLTRVVD